MFLQAVVAAICEQPELELVGSATNGADAVTEALALEPDVVVLDMRLPGLNGHEVLALVTGRLPGTRVLFLSAHIESDTVYSALAGGAAGYLSKEVDREAISAAIAAVARGETVLSPEVQHELAGAIRRRDGHERPGLTPREHAILALAAEGLSTREIATRLSVGSATVKTHLQSIFHKLDVQDRASAVAVAMRRGMLE
jgi:two-component system nitrate/nitrite response regulator NarL